ncbi:membrane protein insertase YidC [Fictibacillus nanhaiensis]|uniref:membrane protein insertase YidC n=1 Tax=Fictibacillus nanhaiensis TaxID=742169 RepID=UPI001C9666C2|nr:membrane protein insertase YidC [Fictibacillus nanhaiensis]MBY6037217.1 membrane protein insertase YidC [Fictibacillus nanhaiensis]
MKIIETIVYPFSQSLYFVADALDGNYGLAIITITMIFRMILLPLFVKQAKQQKNMRKSLQTMKPELEELQKKYMDCKKPEELKKKQEEMVQLYRKYNINPLTIGCLPMLIQLPIVMGMYWAVIETSELSNLFFLMFDFTKTSIVLACLAGLVYYIQGKVSQDIVPTTSQPNMRWMILLSPIIIFIVSLASPAILPFYWSVNGLLLIVQSVIIKIFV